MPKDTVFTVKIESDLRAAFIAEAEAVHRPASQLVRDFMRDFIAERRAAREHDGWFRRQVEEGVRQAEDNTFTRIPHEEITGEWQTQLAALMKKAGRRHG
jgi:predicted transcriptional regulator